jgi:hypothetical protein
MSFYPIADVSEFFSNLANEIKEDIISRLPDRVSTLSLLIETQHWR